MTVTIMNTALLMMMQSIVGLAGFVVERAMNSFARCSFCEFLKKIIELKSVQSHTRFFSRILNLIENL